MMPIDWNRNAPKYQDILKKNFWPVLAMFKQAYSVARGKYSWKCVGFFKKKKKKRKLAQLKRKKIDRKNFGLKSPMLTF